MLLCLKGTPFRDSNPTDSPASSPLNAENGNGAHSYGEPILQHGNIITSHLINLQWHPASYFALNSPPAATSACTKSIICMGVGLHLRNSARGGAAHAQ